MLQRIGIITVLVFSGLVAVGMSATAQGDDDETPGGPARPPVFAIQTAQPSATPYFSVELEPGESIELLAAVRTFDSMPLALRVFSTNAFTLPNGGFGAGNEEDEPEGTTTWISFPAQTLEMGSTDSIEIPFTVTVPDDADPGQHITALVARTEGGLAVGDLANLQQVIRSLIAVLITVPGDLNASFALGQPAFAGSPTVPILEIPIENTGNVLVRPVGRVTIATPDGDVITEAPITMGSVYAGDATTIEVYLPQQFVYGDYVISAELMDPESEYADEFEGLEVTYEPHVAVADATPQAVFEVDPVAISPVGEPVQFADVAITVTNRGQVISTGRVVLRVANDGETVEDYILSQNQAMPNGESTIATRYIPATGWQSGTYSFEIVVISVDQNGAETVLATIPVEDTIEIP